MSSTVRPSAVRKTYVDHPDFHVPEKLHTIIESMPADRNETGDRSQVSENSSGVLDAESERLMFLRMNCFKYLAAERRSKAEGDSSREADRRAAAALESSAKELRDELAVRYLIVVKHVVRSLTPDRGLQDDLFSEGSLILLRVIDFFDVRMGYRFSSYASAALRRELRRQLLRHLRKRPVMLSSVEIDPAAQEETERIFGDEHVAAARDFLSTLPVREQEILRDRFGFNGKDRIQSYRELSERFGVSGERLRQIVERAFRKARRLIPDAA